MPAQTPLLIGRSGEYVTAHRLSGGILHRRNGQFFSARTRFVVALGRVISLFNECRLLFAVSAVSKSSLHFCLSVIGRAVCPLPHRSRIGTASPRVRRTPRERNRATAHHRPARTRCPRPSALHRRSRARKRANLPPAGAGLPNARMACRRNMAGVRQTPRRRRHAQPCRLRPRSVGAGQPNRRHGHAGQRAHARFSNTAAVQYQPFARTHYPHLANQCRAISARHRPDDGSGRGQPQRFVARNVGGVAAAGTEPPYQHFGTAHRHGGGARGMAVPLPVAFQPRHACAAARVDLVGFMAGGVWRAGCLQKR